MASLYSRLTYSALTASLILAPKAGWAQDTITTRPLPPPSASAATSSPTPVSAAPASSSQLESPMSLAGGPPIAAAPRPLDDDRYSPPAPASDAGGPALPVNGPPPGAVEPTSVLSPTQPVAATSLAPPPVAATATPLAPVASPPAAPEEVADATPTAALPATRLEASGRALVRGPVRHDTAKTRTIKVGQGDTINVIAKRLMTPGDALIRANNLKKPFDLDVGQSLLVPTPTDYVTESGDTLSGVSRRFGVSASVLAELNGFGEDEHLRVGEKVALPLGAHDVAKNAEPASSPEVEKPSSAPVAPKPVAAARPEASSTPVAASTNPPLSSSVEPSHPVPYSEAPPVGPPSATPLPPAPEPVTPAPIPPAPIPSAPIPSASVAPSAVQAAPATAPIPTQTQPSAPPERTPPPAEPEFRLSIQGQIVADRVKSREMRVGAGDTVNIIADRLLTPKEELIKLNRLKKPFQVQRGQILKIPTPQAYVADSGDTLAGVARRFGTTAAVLAEINDMDEDGRLRGGQKIALPINVRDGGPVRTFAPPSRPAAHYVFGGEPSSSDGGYRPQPPSRLAPPAYAAPLVIDQTPPPTDAEIVTAGHGRFAWPVSGQLLSGFGPKPGGQRNDGVDLAAPLGSPVTAAAEGDVVYAGNLVPGFGNLVLIRHQDGWVTAYAFLLRIEVKIKDHVTQGEELGQVGQSGGVSQPQLHFEIRYAPTPRDKARPIDPILVLPTR